MKSKSEARYYPVIRRYLTEKLNCVTWSWDGQGNEIVFERRGYGRLIVDVYGLCGEDEINSRTVQGYAVEVKRGTERTSFRHIQQAFQYSRIAHRCYLAQPREFDDVTVSEASRVGIGLLQIKGTQVKKIAESQQFHPDPDRFLTFVRRSLNIFRCSLCGCYRFRYKNLENRNSNYTGGHWRKDQIAELLPKAKGNKKVYFCDKCEDLLYPNTKSRKRDKS